MHSVYSHSHHLLWLVKLVKRSPEIAPFNTHILPRAFVRYKQEEVLEKLYIIVIMLRSLRSLKWLLTILRDSKLVLLFIDTVLIYLG